MPIGNALSIVRCYRQFIPFITSSDTVSGVLNTPGFSYQITADNDPVSFKMSPTLGGLTLNTTTGLITGTPTTLSIGGTSVTLSATNAAGTGIKKILVKIPPPPPVITPQTYTFIQNTTLTMNIVASNMITTYNPIYYATNLPTGLTFTNSNGIITGKVSTIGTYNIPVSASNASGIDRNTITLNIVQPAPVVTIISNKNFFIPGDSIVLFINATNNPTSYTIGNLPSYLTYNDTTHAITGITPTERFHSTNVISVTASNSTGSNAGRTMIIILQPPKITNLPNSGIVITTSGKKGGTVANSTLQILADNMDNGFNTNLNASWRYTVESGPANAMNNLGVVPNTGDTLLWDGFLGDANNVPGLFFVSSDGFGRTPKGTYIVNVTASNVAGSDTKQLTIIIN